MQDARSPPCIGILMTICDGEASGRHRSIISNRRPVESRTRPNQLGLGSPHATPVEAGHHPGCDEDRPHLIQSTSVLERCASVEL